MTKRSAMIAVGAALLVIGLTGLGLLQTGVIFPPSSIKAPALKLSEQAPAGRMQPPGPVNQAPQPFEPPPQSQAGPPAQAGLQPSTGTPAVQEPVPQAGIGGGPDQTRGSTGLAQRPPQQAPGETASNQAAGPAARKPLPAYSMRPLVIRFNFDPARGRSLNVALVHLGDKIRIKMRRVGQVDRRVYFTFSRSLNSRQGAVLELKTMYSFERAVSSQRDRGYYEIQIKIYPGNRWKIMPRSLVWPDCA